MSLDCTGGETQGYLAPTIQDLDDQLDGDLDLPGNRVWVELEYRNLKLWSRVWPEGGRRPALARGGVRFGPRHFTSSSFSREESWILNPGKLVLSAQGFSNEHPLKISDVSVTELLIGPKLGTARGAAHGDRSQMQNGRYFAMDRRIDARPDYDALVAAGRLPSVVMSDQSIIDLYEYAWQSTFDRVWIPGQSSSHDALYRSFLDESYNTHAFMWDLAAMTWFAKYMNGAGGFDPMGSIDIWYQTQRDSGAIARVVHPDGSVPGWAVADGEVNPPLLVWSEWQWYQMTGDEDRVRRVLPALREFVDWVSIARWSQAAEHRLYWNDWGGSGMDIIARPHGRWTDGGHAWGDPDMSGQLAQAYLLLGDLYGALGHSSDAAEMRAIGEAISERIDHFLWKTVPEGARTLGQWYYADENGNIAADSGAYDDAPQAVGLWPVLAGAGAGRHDEVRNIIVSPDQYNTDIPFAGVAKSHSAYRGWGDYNHGVVPPVAYMGIKAAEQVGGFALAQRLATKYVEAMAEVYDYSGTIWEMYAPQRQSSAYLQAFRLTQMESFQRAQREAVSTCTAAHCEILKRDYELPERVEGHAVPASRWGNRASAVKPVFTGWGALPPIALTIEHLIGIRADVPDRTVTWHITRTDRHGIENLWLGEMGRVDLIAEARSSDTDPVTISVTTADHTEAYGELTLVVALPGGCTRTLTVPQGTTDATRTAQPCQSATEPSIEALWAGASGSATARATVEVGNHRSDDLVYLRYRAAADTAWTATAAKSAATTVGFVLRDLTAGTQYEVEASLASDYAAAESAEFTTLADVSSPTGPTVQFDRVPARHNGSSPFTFRVSFSEKVAVSFRDFSGALLDLSGATVLTARRLQRGSNAGWEVDVQPDGNGLVSIAVRGDRSCDDPGAVCNHDRVRLVGSATAQVAGPAPTVTTEAAFTVPEMTTEVAALTAADGDTPADRLRWSIPSGAAGGADAGKFTVTASGTLSFAAPKDFESPDDADADGTYLVTVQVTDGTHTATEDLTVSLSNVNEAPVADAGADLSGVAQGATVTLTGTGSDPDAGDRLAYRWTQTAGASVTLSAADTATATFAAPSGLSEASTLTFSLRVSDAEGAFHDDTVSISVAAAELPEEPEPMWTATLTVGTIAQGQKVFHGYSFWAREHGFGALEPTYFFHDEFSAYVHLIAYDQHDGLFLGMTALPETFTLAVGSRCFDRSDGTLRSNIRSKIVNWPGADVGDFAEQGEVGVALWDTASDCAAAAVEEPEQTVTTETDTTPVEEGDEGDTTPVDEGDTGDEVDEGDTGDTVDEGDTTPGDEVDEPSADWGERLTDYDIDLGSDANPSGLWSDGTHLWAITDSGSGEITVYDLADGTPQTDRGYTLTDAGSYVTSLWSDGTTLWVADFAGHVRAYRLSDGARASAHDLDSATLAAAGNSQPSGLWSDGDIMWVADYSAQRIFAYRLSTKARLVDREFSLARTNGQPYNPFGIWSDGTTMLVSVWAGTEILAHDLATGQRQSSFDISTAASGTKYPLGIWSNGSVLWIASDTARAALAYAAPGAD